MPFSSQRSLLLAASLAFITPPAVAYAGWRSIGNEAPTTYIAREKPRAVRFVVAESTFVLTRPLISGDSLIGTLESGPQRKIVVAASDVRKFEVASKYAPKGVRLAMMGMGIVVVSTVAALLIVNPGTAIPL
jgi:hypothetical protein